MVTADHRSPSEAAPSTVDVPSDNASRRGDRRLPRFETILWLVPFAVLALFVAGRIGLDEPFATVETAAGPVTVPNGWAGVDHPFHAVRAETLRRSLAAGEILRWVGHHQGGYPVEFYPLGAAWIAVVVWAAGFGALPMETAYGVSVWLVFLLPGLAWVVAARRDRLPIGTAFLALAIHVAVPGAWWHGGYTELVQWGLVTNVAASAWVLVALLSLAAYLADGRATAGAVGMAAAAGALLTNPRSLVALTAVGLGICLSGWLSRFPRRTMAGDSGRGLFRRLLTRMAIVAAGSFLLAAPEIVALARFSGLYEFVRYEGYASASDWWSSTLVSVSPPVVAFSVVGLAVAWLGPARPFTRAASLTLPLYGGLTLLAAANPDSGLLEQLEATRLMPFQRLLTIWLGAVGVLAIVAWLWRLIRPTANRPLLPETGLRPMGAPGAASLRAANVAALLLAIVAVGWWVRPGLEGTPLPGPPDAPERGLYPVERTGVAEQAAFEAMVREADAVAPAGTALLAIGSRLSWHQQLWAPLWTSRPLMYDNWLWYWHLDHAGPPGYVALRGHHYPDPSLALASDYLRRHGIGGAVATTGAAPGAPPAGLRSLATAEGYRAMAVSQPTTLVTSGGLNATETVYANGRIGATLTADGEIVVRHNWFPRWKATLDGSPAGIARAPDGTMRLAGGRAGQRLELVYAVEGWDWIARALSAAGVVGIVVWIGSGWRRRGIREGTAPPPGAARYPPSSG